MAPQIPRTTTTPPPHKTQPHPDHKRNLLDLLRPLLLAYADDLAVVAGEKQQLADYSTAVTLV